MICCHNKKKNQQYRERDMLFFASFFVDIICTSKPTNRLDVTVHSKVDKKEKNGMLMVLCMQTQQERLGQYNNYFIQIGSTSIGENRR